MRFRKIFIFTKRSEAGFIGAVVKIFPGAFAVLIISGERNIVVFKNKACSGHQRSIFDVVIIFIPKDACIDIIFIIAVLYKSIHGKVVCQLVLQSGIQQSSIVSIFVEICFASAVVSR